ncbi:hypothetical protein Patl1_11669 [Pistacia atlantica]|uniref:Uncharacterized protein n=1 Tax=Pistacia atlantica TaxID=434234 RepID=A0ACC1A7I1_9ROSI|nr:hypothetical protein Patl1_11669 [Pistacia atlantica]
MKLENLVSLEVLILLLNFSFIICCHDHERGALLSFKSQLTDPGNLLSSWQGQNCCTWHGINCSESLHVSSINLRNPNPLSEMFIIKMNKELVSRSSTKSTALNGTISSSLFSLTNLTYLDLSFNNLMYTNIPSGFSNLTKLTYLNLSNAMFSGSITTQFSNLTLLTHLDVSCSYVANDFSTIGYNLSSSLQIYTGAEYGYIYAGHLSLPSLDFLQVFHNLRVLSLRGVDLSKATNSNQWANPLSFLSNLQRLQLSNCRISGKLPAKQLLNLTNLSVLMMDFNFFASPIPGELANLTSLSRLYLTKSHLQGPIPYLPQLTKLDVGNNSEMIIDLHSMFAAPWPRLLALDISSTQVIGSFPTSFANTSTLTLFKASNCFLQGPIPPPLMNLSKLEILALDFNNITDHLWSDISKLKNLRLLNIMQNSLQGSIPSSICNISSLQYLSLAGNHFTGNLPGCISQLSRLKYLMLSSNNMNGMIESFASLIKSSNLEMIALGFSGLTVKVDQNPFPPSFQPQYLDLNACLLGGTIPDFISNLTQVRFLTLSHNNLSGSIPSWLLKLPKLGYLDLSSNQLQGVLPPHIELHSFELPTTLNLASNQLRGSIPPLLENVEAVDFSGNNFTGYIPLELGTGEVKYLSLSGNKLHGQIPSSFCHSNNKLMLLDLSNNSLEGTVPTSLGNCTSLIFLKLGGNNLRGEFPDGLEGAKSLSFLDLTGSHFGGPFPGFILELQDLGVLKLGYNRFQGKIPPSIGDLQNLRILVLESNFFNGSIPPEINKLEKLQYVDLSSNKLSGSIPERLDGLKMMRTRPQDGNLLGYVISSMYTGVELDMVSKGLFQKYEVVRTYLNGIDFSANSLTGNIPSEIGLLKGLYMLNLSHNQLFGEIPITVSEMSGLESLDLSFNNLSGNIPTAITFLDYLSAFNLSYNNFSGRIPTGQHFDTVNIDGSAYTGNAFLCGVAINIKCHDNDSSGSETTVDVEDSRQEMFYAAVVGYGAGSGGFFTVLSLLKENWRKKYWRNVDLIAMAIIQRFRKQENTRNQII